MAGSERSVPERRSGGDRRQPGDRRSGDDRRQQALGRPEGERRRGERRSGRDRRGPVDRRGAGRLSLAPDDAPPPALVRAARAARAHAVAPYSRFAVGAALETAGGAVVTGCNLESASYGLTMCAERVALFKALSEGHRRFTRLVVATGAATPAPPCGACRQVLWEFCGDLEVTLANDEREFRYRLRDLLPMPFDARHVIDDR